jgi:hypothetical protein
MDGDQDSEISQVKRDGRTWWLLSASKTAFCKMCLPKKPPWPLVRKCLYLQARRVHFSAAQKHLIVGRKLPSLMHPDSGICCAPVRGEMGILKNIFVGNLSFNTVEG